MKTLARLGIMALVVTYLHMVFGGIVRITGAGMGCGDHWPKCNGAWLPPFDNPLVLIEWTHRLLASVVLLATASLAITAWLRRRTPGVAGRGGVLRPAVTAVALVLAVALLGMVTVKLSNTTMATVAHWTLALALLAVIAAAAVRAGALGGTSAREGEHPGTPRAVRSLGAGAALAFLAVVLGGLVAKFPGAAVACPGFPLCGATPADIPAGAAHVQLAHRIVAYLLAFHLLAVSAALSRRANESRVVKRAAKTTLGLVALQVVLGASMVLATLPSELRVAHQALGIAVWLAMFLATYLAGTSAARHRTADMIAEESIPHGSGPGVLVRSPVSHTRG